MKKHPLSIRASSVSFIAIILFSLPSNLLAQPQNSRQGFTSISLTRFTQPLLSGDPNQLPLIALHDQFANGKAIPSVTFDRSNPKQIIAIVRDKQHPRTSTYRVEMARSGSLCDCQKWKVVWIGKQN